MIDEVHCQICAEGILGEQVLCERCCAPHHEDCWRFNGGCAIYACFGRRFSRSTESLPLAPSLIFIDDTPDPILPWFRRRPEMPRFWTTASLDSRLLLLLFLLFASVIRTTFLEIAVEDTVVRRVMTAPGEDAGDGRDSPSAVSDSSRNGVPSRVWPDMQQTGVAQLLRDVDGLRRGELVYLLAAASRTVSIQGATIQTRVHQGVTESGRLVRLQGHDFERVTGSHDLRSPEEAPDLLRRTRTEYASSGLPFLAILLEPWSAHEAGELLKVHRVEHSGETPAYYLGRSGETSYRVPVQICQPVLASGLILRDSDSLAGR